MVNERVPMSAVTIDELTLADELAIAVFRTALTQPLRQLAVDLHGCGAWCGHAPIVLPPLSHPKRGVSFPILSNA
jgi:hypothetical protein